MKNPDINVRTIIQVKRAFFFFTKLRPAFGTVQKSEVLPMKAKLTSHLYPGPKSRLS
jgi:hypothetical protein